MCLHGSPPHTAGFLDVPDRENEAVPLPSYRRHSSNLDTNALVPVPKFGGFAHMGLLSSFSLLFKVFFALHNGGRVVF